MKKVVINDEFGGFDISPRVLKELVLRNAKCIESFTPKQYYGGDNINNPRTSEWEQEWNKDFKEYFNIGRGFKTDRWGFAVYKKGLIYVLKNRDSIEVRTDPDLVEIIERIGEKKASTRLSSLKIIEVPDNVEFEIDNYDGYETIKEICK